MKNLLKKTNVVLFVAFLTISMLLTLIINYNGIITSLHECKESLLQYKTMSATITSVFSDNLFLLKNYSDIYGGIQRIQGKNAVWSNKATAPCVIGDDKKLYTLNLFSNVKKNELSEKDMDRVLMCAEELSDLADEVVSRGELLFFVQAPARYNHEYVTLPLPQSSGRPKSIDALYEKLENNKNINLINLQQRFKDEGIDFNTMFYKTDHHWTTKTAFSAYQEICREINEKTDISIDEKLFDSENWDIKTKKRSFLGSLGGEAGGWFVEKDDFDFIFPKFETKYKKVVARVPQASIKEGGSWTENGSFTEAVLNTEKKDIIFGAYVSPDVSEVIIKNLMTEQNKKILIIKDSFALPVSAFLSTCFAETRMLDVRYFKDGVIDYIDSYKPDIVLVLYNPTSYNSDCFSFK